MKTIEIKADSIEKIKLTNSDLISISTGEFSTDLKNSMKDYAPNTGVELSCFETESQLKAVIIGFNTKSIHFPKYIQIVDGDNLTYTIIKKS